jgi:hypothetical protein
MGDPPSDPGVNVSDNSPHESFASLQLPLKFVGRKGVEPDVEAGVTVTVLALVESPIAFTAFK